MDAMTDSPRIQQIVSAWLGEFWRISAMSWEMATARLEISSRVQILWVIARVQEGKTLPGYPIVAILQCAFLFWYQAHYQFNAVNEHIPNNA